ncbi:MAG: hypothetical protein MUF84_08470 [Anaerolineae bacterium]|nr:hypothetical protein [Anaerolineae bacterium]
MVKVAAVALATLGLALLWVLTQTVEIPSISIHEASSLMNFGYVRLSGRVVRGPTYDAESGYLGFWLADETGEAYVSAYRDVTDDLLGRDVVPAVGDEVSVAGTLRIREDHVALTLNVADHLTLRRPEPIPLKAGEVTILDEGMRVRLAGEVRRVYEPYEGLMLITLGDESGEIVVAVDEEATALTGSLPEPDVGQGIEIEGAVSLYHATPQVVPASVADVALLPASVVTATLPAPVLSALGPELVGKVVSVGGRVVWLEGIQGGVKATLDDSTAQVTLLVWDDVYHSLPAPTELDVGAEVEIIGKVSIYEGELEIIPEEAKDIVIRVPAEAPLWAEIAGLGPDDAGRLVRVRGVLREPEGFSAGVKVLVDDGSGSLQLLFWSSLYEDLSPEPHSGQQVEVIGIVNVYRDELELIPRSPYDWRVRPPDD